jgi:hypothetical protein
LEWEAEALLLVEGLDRVDMDNILTALDQLLVVCITLSDKCLLDLGDLVVASLRRASRLAQDLEAAHQLEVSAAEALLQLEGLVDNTDNNTHKGLELVDLEAGSLSVLAFLPDLAADSPSQLVAFHQDQVAASQILLVVEQERCSHSLQLSRLLSLLLRRLLKLGCQGLVAFCLMHGAGCRLFSSIYCFDELQVVLVYITNLSIKSTDFDSLVLKGKKILILLYVRL